MWKWHILYSITGPYVDQAGVALTSGGGTLVLSTHDNVCFLVPSVDCSPDLITFRWLQIVGPGGQDVFTDGDGPILVYHYYTSAGNNVCIVPNNIAAMS